MNIQKLKNPLALSLLAGVALASGAAAQAGAQWTALRGGGGADLVASQPMAAEGARSLPGIERAPVAFSYALPADQALQQPAPFVAESREYWMEVSGAQLRAGAPIETALPGALVRINPAGKAQLEGRADGLALEPAALELRSAAGSFVAGSGMELLASAEALRESGAPFVAGTSAFRVAPQVGAGRVLVVAPLAVVTERYVIHVFEPKSEQTLRLGANQTSYLHGQQLVVSAALGDAKSRLRFDQAEAYVSAPGGRAWPLTFSRQKDGSYRGTINLDAREAAPEGLWEVNLVARGRGQDGLAVVRGARTAFSVALPTAAFEGQAGIRRGDNKVVVELPLQVGTAGRYEARGILYGTNAAGVLQPMMIAHFANWLEAGRGSLSLTFENLAAGFKAPYELRDLRLYDQGRMGLLHRQDQALVLP